MCVCTWRAREREKERERERESFKGRNGTEIQPVTFHHEYCDNGKIL